MQTADVKINDFGQKIGGAKKDLAQESVERMKLITNDVLIRQPLSKSFPRPDFAKMCRENRISEEQALRLQYLYLQIEVKPRAEYRLQGWLSRTGTLIAIIRDGLEKEESLMDEVRFRRNEFLYFREEMKAAGWPQEDYSPHPYKICRFCEGGSGVTKGQMIQKRGTLQQCVDWIKENAGGKKPVAEPQYSIYRYRFSGEVFITPKGKKNVILVRGLKSFEEARIYLEEKPGELKKAYDTFRFIPGERNKCNRPRSGQDCREGRDISPETFASLFPFRGVEFGNWVSQAERAASLNEACDALSDLACVLGTGKTAVTLDGKLALAFGARGSGDASAHYERERKVINLTKTRGAGSLAHEWFHALDNYLCAKEGNPLLLASEKPADMQDKLLAGALQALCTAIGRSDFYRRSEKIDRIKTKKYWAAMTELAARAFEKHVICKLAEQGYENDYLANIVSFEKYARQEIYPYPTDEENRIFSPLFDRLISCAMKVELKQVA
jgi:hypothetical protein